MPIHVNAKFTNWGDFAERAKAVADDAAKLASLFRQAAETMRAGAETMREAGRAAGWTPNRPTDPPLRNERGLRPTWREYYERVGDIVTVECRDVTRLAKHDPNADQPALFTYEVLPDEPNAEQPVQRREAAGRLYIYKDVNGVRYFLWKTHTNGGPVWTSLGDCGRRRPLWFANVHTARNAVVRYDADGFDVWGAHNEQ